MITGMSQTAVASAVEGMDPTALTRIETGRRRVQLNELDAMARKLGVPLDYFLSEETPAEVRAYVDRVTDDLARSL
jgi:transcriptional regulator with XRE-family HTH domain